MTHIHKSILRLRRLITVLLMIGSGLAMPTQSSAQFVDVPTDYWAFSFIGALGYNGITSGCGNGMYCPKGSVTRAQMAVFLERGIHGGGYSPPAAKGNVFLDVSAQSFAASFIEQFYLDGITSGCGNNNYCPDAEVTRDQMAVFLLRAKHGSGYSPPPASGVFGDVDLSHWAVHWIEQLAAEGITSGCGNGNYCPDAVVTRDQMAVFLVRTFNLSFPPSTVFILPDPALAEPGGSLAFTMNGSLNTGETVTVDWSIARRANTIFNGQSVRQTDQLIVIIIDGVSEATSTTTYTDLDGAFVQSVSSSGVSTFPDSPQTPLPQTAVIGDFGFFGNWISTDGSSSTGSWRLDAHGTSATLADLFAFTSIDNLSGVDVDSQLVRTIDTSGNTVALSMEIFLSDGATLFASSD